MLRSPLHLLTLQIPCRSQNVSCRSAWCPRAFAPSSRPSSSGHPGRTPWPPGKILKLSASASLLLPLGDKRAPYRGGVLLPLLRRSPTQLGHGAHLGPSAQTSVCPGESGFGPSRGVRELAPACASRASRGWVPCLRGKREQSSACMNKKHNTLLWRNLSSMRIPSLPLADPISDPLSSPVANILVSDSFVPRHLPLAQVDQRRRASSRSRRPRLSPVSSSCAGDHPNSRRLG